MELINSPICCKLKFIRMYYTRTRFSSIKNCLFHSLCGNYHAIVGWTNNGRLHSQAWILSWQTLSLQPSITKNQFWKGKLTSKKKNLISPEESTQTKDEAPQPVWLVVSNLILSNQHKSQLVFSDCLSSTRYNWGQTNGTLHTTNRAREKIFLGLNYLIGTWYMYINWWGKIFCWQMISSIPNTYPDPSANPNPNPNAITNTNTNPSANPNAYLNHTLLYFIIP